MEKLQRSSRRRKSIMSAIHLLVQHPPLKERTCNTLHRAQASARTGAGGPNIPSRGPQIASAAKVPDEILLCILRQIELDIYQELPNKMEMAKLTPKEFKQMYRTLVEGVDAYFQCCAACALVCKRWYGTAVQCLYQIIYILSIQSSRKFASLRKRALYSMQWHITKLLDAEEFRKYEIRSKTRDFRGLRGLQSRYEGNVRGQLEQVHRLLEIRHTKLVRTLRSNPALGALMKSIILPWHIHIETASTYQIILVTELINHCPNLANLTCTFQGYAIDKAQPQGLSHRQRRQEALRGCYDAVARHRTWRALEFGTTWAAEALPIPNTRDIGSSRRIWGYIDATLPYFPHLRSLTMTDLGTWPMSSATFSRTMARLPALKSLTWHHYSVPTSVWITNNLNQYYRSFLSAIPPGQLTELELVYVHVHGKVIFYEVLECLRRKTPHNPARTQTTTGAVLRSFKFIVVKQGTQYDGRSSSERLPIVDTTDWRLARLPSEMICAELSKEAMVTLNEYSPIRY